MLLNPYHIDVTGLNLAGLVAVGLLAFFCLNPAFGAGNQNADIKPLPLSIEWHEDTTNRLDLAHILSFTEELKPFNGRANFGTRDSTLWFKVEIPASNSHEVLLEIGYPLLDQLDVFKQVDGVWQKSEMGDTRPFSLREYPHPLFIVPVNTNTGEPQTIYLRVRSKGPISVPINAWDADDFHQHDSSRAIFNGLYFGALLALILFNLFIYLSVKDSSYLYYVAYLGLIALFMAITSGLLTRYILPDIPLFTNRLSYFFLYSAMIVGLGFTTSINNTSTYAPKMLLPTRILATVLLVVLFIGNTINMYILSILTPYLAITMISLTLHVTLLSVRAGYKPSYFVAFAFLAIVAGGLFNALGYAGILSDEFWVESGLKLGVVLEALLLSFALAYRIKYAQEKLEETREIANQERADFSKKLIETRDQERQQIATELHDGLGHNLLVIKNKLSRLLAQERKNEIPHKPLNNVQQVVQTTIENTRNLSHRLYPHILNRLGFKDAIEAVIKDTFQGLDVVVRCDTDNITLPKDAPLGIHLYRIIQEGVKNIVQHTDPARVEISLSQSPDTIELRIEDYPHSLQDQWINSLELSHCFGLSSIQERVELLMGNTVFSHNDSGGFRIEISVPFLP